jgi:hypothetical protein
MRMKKKCGACKALSLDLCGLGYKINIMYKQTTIGLPYLEHIPLELCEKPLTNKRFCDLIIKGE